MLHKFRPANSRSPNFMGCGCCPHEMICKFIITSHDVMVVSYHYSVKCCFIKLHSIKAVVVVCSSVDM